MEIYIKDKVNIKFEDGDMWDVGHSMMEVLLQVIRKFRESSIGVPYVPDEDVPEYFHEAHSEDDFEYGFSQDRYNYVLGEIEWALAYVINDDWDPELSDHEEREARYENGMRLLGKYLSSLWN